jgi:hypothetical protein
MLTDFSNACITTNNENYTSQVKRANRAQRERARAIRKRAVGEVRNVRKRNRESGQSLILVACSLVVLIGMLGLAVDAGYLRYVRRELQTAADAAALAGAMDVYYGSASVLAAGYGASSENGFATGANGVTVTINNPPLHGPFAGTSYPTYVEAIVQDTSVPTFFSKIFGVNNVTLSASSVAAGGINCIYGLDTLSGGALSLTASVVNSRCGVVDNSNLTGLAGLLCAPSIQLKGSDSIIFGGTCSAGFTAAKPVAITQTVADPFASLPLPAVLAPPTAPASCVSPNCFTTAHNIATTATISQLPIYEGGTVINAPGSVVTVNPGTYFGPATGGPAFKITNTTVVFNPGTYYIESRAAGQPGIQIQSTTIGGATKVSFGSGTYTVYGGITDNNVFGSAVNWNSTGSSASLFIIDGGGLKLTGTPGTSGSASTSTGGVTFFNTGTAAAGTPTTYGPIVSYFDFAAFCGASCQLSAPTTGTYAGILFFNAPTNTATATCPGSGLFGSATANACFAANFSAGGPISHAGAYYFPNAKVAFNFDFGLNAPYSFLVANDISWFFAFTFGSTYTSLPNGSPVKQGSAVLVQ